MQANMHKIKDDKILPNHTAIFYICISNLDQSGKISKQY